MTDALHVRVRSATALRFDDGAPVRAASGLAPLGAGWLVAQDDATSAAWWTDEGVRRLRLLPPVGGHDVFSAGAGTKHLKPDLEAATPVRGGVLLLGSGSTPARMRGVLVDGASHAVTTAELSALYAEVVRALDVDPELLNLEGACVVDGVLRWFQRGAASLPSASVDVDLGVLLGHFAGHGGSAVRGVRTYDLGEVDGVPLGVTDAVALDDGTVLVSAAAEDTPNPYDDGPVVATVLALLDDEGVRSVARLPEVDGCAAKVEGLALRAADDRGLEVLAVVDADDPAAASLALVLELRR